MAGKRLSVFKRPPPPDRERPRSLAREGRSLAPATRMPRWKPKGEDSKFKSKRWHDTSRRKV